jgi:hypothetical protein
MICEQKFGSAGGMICKQKFGSAGGMGQNMTGALKGRE